MLTLLPTKGLDMLFLLRALNYRRMRLSFNASASHRVFIYERPGEWMAPGELAALVAECRTVVRACLWIGFEAGPR